MDERIGVIADDLTGAMDTAGAFASAGLRTAVALTPSSSIDGRDWRVLCVNTQSRNASVAAITASVSSAVRMLAQDQARVLYKKIDSTMRRLLAVVMWMVWMEVRRWVTRRRLNSQLREKNNKKN